MRGLLSPPLATSPSNMLSVACKTCENDLLGDSSCAASDLTCLWI
jgi:hypothetical protein